MNYILKKSKYYMWLDIDILPLNPKRFLKNIKNLQINENNGIALTKTRNKEKERYNGGFFIYSNRLCINYWKKLVLFNLENDTKGRDQPYLKLATQSKYCNVTLLHKKTQIYANTMRFNLFKLQDYDFIHFTGNTKYML